MARSPIPSGKPTEYNETITVRLTSEQVADLFELRWNHEKPRLSQSAMVRRAVEEYIVNHLDNPISRRR